MIITIAIIKQNYILKLCNITQVYSQLSFKLNREIFAKLPKELRDKYLQNTIIQVIHPFYGIAKSDVHWWFTYHKHHLEKLNMVTLTYDSCMLITFNGFFSISGMQINDTLIICSLEFSAKEEEKIQKAAFRAKPKA
jgi:hypothetical protein